MIRYVVDSLGWDSAGSIVYMNRKIYKSKYWAERYYDKQEEDLQRNYYGWFLTRYVTPFPDKIPDILKKLSNLD